MIYVIRGSHGPLFPFAHICTARMGLPPQDAASDSTVRSHRINNPGLAATAWPTDAVRVTLTDCCALAPVGERGLLGVMHIWGDHPDGLLKPFFAFSFKKCDEPLPSCCYAPYCGLCFQPGHGREKSGFLGAVARTSRGQSLTRFAEAARALSACRGIQHTATGPVLL